MSKATKVASAPSVAAKAAKETTGSVVSIGVMVLLLIFVVIPMLPAIGGALVENTAQAAGEGANKLGKLSAYTPPGPAGGWRGKSPGDTVPTTTPAPKPYEGSNGAIKPLPSQLSPPAARPTLGESSGGLGPLGELLGKIPEVGPAIEGGLKAIGPAAEALKKAP